MGQVIADKIDGDWRFPDNGRNLHIQGDDLVTLVTPNGTGTKGDDTRHIFRYVVPSDDPGAGDKINLRQLSDQTMVLVRPDGEEEIWQRCDLQTS